jgi:hypothetical protein
VWLTGLGKLKNPMTSSGKSDMMYRTEVCRVQQSAYYVTDFAGGLNVAKQGTICGVSGSD